MVTPDSKTIPSASEKKRRAKKIILIIISVLLGLIIALLSAFGLLHMIGKRQFHESDKNISVTSDTDIEIDEDTVYYNGREYVLNSDIVTVLFMGVDKKSINDSEVQGLNGQADTIIVAAVDVSDKSIDLIPIPRETMTDVSIYNVDGEYVGTRYEQICLAYAYGDSPESSGGNVKTAVSRLLYGINISTYVSLDLSGVGVLTDAVGGIELTCLETLDGRYKMTEGQALSLKGDKAVYYIQHRGDDEQSSTRRLQRQKQFMSAFASKAGNMVLADFTKLASLYNTAQPYVYTDLTLAQLTYLATSCLTADIGNTINYVSFPGSSAMGEKWVEFTPDNDALLDTVINVFYEEK